MKLNRTYLFIAISSVALLIVLIIQVNWILQSAKIKEELFNEKANMVLSKTADALLADKETYRNLAAANMVLSKKVNALHATDKTTYKNLPSQVSEEDTHTIDSLFNHFMKVYNIRIDYFFEIKTAPVKINKQIAWANSGQKQGTTSTKKENSFNQTDSYQTCIGGGDDKNNLEFKLVFPGKEQFIVAEMGIPFITSVVLILVVLVMSWRTILSLLKEKRISEHTTDFLNNMTHEFKTPLTNIALAGKMMVKDSNIKEENRIKHYSGIILEENEKLRHQVEQVLSMTALERGEIPLQKTELDFHQLIHDAIKCISVQIENTQGHLTLSLDATQFVITGDKQHLTNALCNLIDNAIKYAKGKPELYIHTFNKGPYLILTVADGGIGIAKAYQKKVFDKFFRVPTGNVHDVKGFGLGLAYIKAIVELHAGTIELQSNPDDNREGKKTIFTITLSNHG
ncbi:MAG: HAMP domain-containing sensor histidine kinase [Bacteroidota bacterium]